MRFLLSLILLLVNVLTAASQVQIPIYKSREDSVKIAEITATINELAGQSTRNTSHLDSLRDKLRTLRYSGITGYRYRYEPNKSFTPIDELIHGKIAHASVKRLSLHGDKFKRLPREVYGCKSLETIEFVDTRLKKLPHRLKKLKGLKTVHIYNNASTRRLKLQNNDVITFLKIRSASGDIVPREYHKLRNLDTLDLMRCNLTRFPNVSRNEKLKQLLLGENQLSLQDLDNIRNLSIEHLGLQRNRIDSVPSSLANFPALKKVVLNYNNISFVDPAFAQLKHLEEVAFYSNKLKAIPPELFQLKELRYLDLYHNEIERIPDAISNLRNLNVLYLASNRIFAISEKIGELTNLRELYLHHNRISSIPETLRNLNDLEIFRFNANRLVDVPDWITSLKNLKNIDFSQNDIHLTPNHILDLRNLQIVAMTENPWEISRRWKN